MRAKPIRLIVSAWSGAKSSLYGFLPVVFLHGSAAVLQPYSCLFRNFLAAFMSDAAV